MYALTINTNSLSGHVLIKHYLATLSFKVRVVHFDKKVYETTKRLYCGIEISACELIYFIFTQVEVTNIFLSKY